MRTFSLLTDREGGRLISTIADLATNDRTARMLLSMLTEPNDARTGHLLRQVGGEEALRLALSEKAAPGMSRVDTEMWRGHIDTGADPESLAQRLRAFEHSGVAVLVPGDKDWPRGFNDLGDRSPYVLWARGATSLLRAPLSDGATITGARAATSYGIDGAAHKAALAAGGRTVAVTAGGINRPYPAGHRELLEQISDLGLITSELPRTRHQRNGVCSHATESSHQSQETRSSLRPAIGRDRSMSPLALPRLGVPWARSPAPWPASRVPAHIGASEKARPSSLPPPTRSKQC